MNIPTTFDFNRQDGYREENDFFLQVTTTLNMDSK